MTRALLAVVVGVALVAGACGGDGDGSASGDLPLLPSSGGGAPTRSTNESASGASGAATAAPATADAATDMIAPGEPYRPVEYRLGPDVDELGGKAAAHRVDADVDEASVTKLAKAFGVTAKPVENATAWEAGDVKGAGSWLRVEANGMFSYANAAAQGIAASSDVAVACAPDTTCTAPEPASPPATVPPADLPSDADAKAKATDLLRAAGVATDGVDARVDRSDYGLTVVFTMEVGDVPVEGFGHSVAFGDKGVVQYASGVLARPSKIGDYPLVDTKGAFERWNTERNGGVTIAGRLEGGAAGSGAAGSGAAGSGAAGSGAAEPAKPVDPATDATDAPPSTLAPQIVTIDRAERALLVEFGRCPGDPLYLVPAYRLYVGDQLHAVVPAVTDDYLEATSEDGDTPVASDGGAGSGKPYEPCPGEEVGKTEPGREPAGGGYPPVTG